MVLTKICEKSNSQGWLRNLIVKDPRRGYFVDPKRPVLYGCTVVRLC